MDEPQAETAVDSSYIVAFTFMDPVVACGAAQVVAAAAVLGFAEHRVAVVVGVILGPVIAAEYDPLRSEAEAYVEAMRSAGATAHLLVAPGMIHAFAFFEQKVPADIDRLTDVSAVFLRTGAVPTDW